MNKVATYLQGHVAGKVATRRDILDHYASTASVISRRPNLVIEPRNTNDIRKVNRFAWQLAEKGHIMGVTVRGLGTDPTGGATGEGVIIDTSVHMDSIFEYDPKQHLLRAQPGALLSSVQAALSLHRSRLSLELSSHKGTLGGAVGFGEDDPVSNKSWIDRLEVVLDNGDVIQTGTISKREFNKRQGAEGREGEIYRGISTILEDYGEVIDALRESGIRDTSGYTGILDVEQKGGGVDLTPLFVASQGTLGIITEMIVRSEYAPSERVYAAALFGSPEAALDAIDAIDRMGPTSLEYIDGPLVAEAMKQGNVYKWMGDDIDAKAVGSDAAMVVIGFDAFKERRRAHLLKKLVKKLSSFDCIFTTSGDADIEGLRTLLDYTISPATTHEHGAPILTPGFYVPHERLEDFTKQLANLADKIDLPLPLYGELVMGVYRVMPTLNLHKVSDKQKLFKLLDGLNALLANFDGSIAAYGGEGRLLARFARSTWGEDVEKMMNDIKKVFDPHGILNPGVKTDVELKELVKEIRNDNAAHLY